VQAVLAVLAPPRDTGGRRECEREPTPLAINTAAVQARTAPPCRRKQNNRTQRQGGRATRPVPGLAPQHPAPRPSGYWGRGLVATFWAWAWHNTRVGSRLSTKYRRNAPGAAVRVWLVRFNTSPLGESLFADGLPSNQMPARWRLSCVGGGGGGGGGGGVSPRASDANA
jgi:hypothetical protein